MKMQKFLVRTFVLAIATYSAASASAQIGTNWSQYYPSRTIQLDKASGSSSWDWGSTSYASVDSPKSAEYQRSGTTEYFRIFDGRSNRAEIRVQNDYSSGNRQTQGYLLFSSPLNDQCLFQIWGSTSGATQLMVRGYSASGGSLRANGTTIATGVYGIEQRVNVIHYQGNYMEVFINGSEKIQINDTETVSNYHKYGCYGSLTTGAVQVRWRDVKFFQK